MLPCCIRATLPLVAVEVGLGFVFEIHVLGGCQPASKAPSAKRCDSMNVSDKPQLPHGSPNAKSLDWWLLFLRFCCEARPAEASHNFVCSSGALVPVSGAYDKTASQSLSPASPQKTTPPKGEDHSGSVLQLVPPSQNSCCILQDQCAVEQQCFGHLRCGLPSHSRSSELGVRGHEPLKPHNALLAVRDSAKKLSKELVMSLHVFMLHLVCLILVLSDNQNTMPITLLPLMLKPSPPQKGRISVKA